MNAEVEAFFPETRAELERRVHTEGMTQPIPNTFQAPHDVREANERKFRQSGNAVDQCFLCGRGLTEKGVSNAWWIHLRTDDSLFPADPVWYDDPQSQGAFPVGSECAKSIPRAYRMKRSA